MCTDRAKTGQAGVKRPLEVKSKKPFIIRPDGVRPGLPASVEFRLLGHPKYRNVVPRVISS